MARTIIKYAQLSTGYSDGCDAHYPTILTKEDGTEADGSWSYFCPVPEGELKDLLWRTKCAMALVEEFAPEEKIEGVEFVLSALPSGYQLFEHLKGKKVCCTTPLLPC